MNETPFPEYLSSLTSSLFESGSTSLSSGGVLGGYISVPLSAAFALSERKRVRLEEAARESNQLNRSRSAGEVCQGVSGYFSYDEVKNMSRAEIRENYNNILLSMQKWH